MAEKEGASGVCAICHGKGIVSVEQDGREAFMACGCTSEKYIFARVGSRFSGLDLSEMKGLSKSQVAALDRVRDDPRGSFYFYGNNRTGKTAIAAALFRAAVGRHKKAVRWYSETELRSVLTAPKFADSDDKWAREAALLDRDAIVRGDLRGVWIDDIGKARMTPATRQAMYEFVNLVYCFTEEVQLVVTSEHSPRELAEICVDGELSYGKAVAARLADVTTAIKLEDSVPLSGAGGVR